MLYEPDKSEAGDGKDHARYFRCSPGLMPSLDAQLASSMFMAD
jgi:hypothetical protein